ncbi:hypothetical protein V2O64_04260 [Verrucomicrobiaceae bacterium 227]
MTRSQFILSMTLLCVAGTLAFMISFRHRESTNASIARLHQPTASSPRLSTRETEPSALLLSPRRLEKVDPTHYEVTVPDIAMQESGSKIERESLQRLEEMTHHYQLTPNQRRQIFPLLVSHHADFIPGLIVNGFPAPGPEDESLPEQIYPLLDLTQQENYQQDILAETDWWGDVLGQLRDDLDDAFERGEVDLVTDAGPVRRNREGSDEDSSPGVRD